MGLLVIELNYITVLLYEQRILCTSTFMKRQNYSKHFRISGICYMQPETESVRTSLAEGHLPRFFPVNIVLETDEALSLTVLNPAT